MKKITFSLNLIIVGSEDSEKDIFFNYLKEIAIRYDSNEKPRNVLLIFQEIPIKIHLYEVNDFGELLDEHNIAEHLDVIIININVQDQKSFDRINLNRYQQVKKYSLFEGLDVIVGMSSLETKKNSHISRIQKIELIEKCKELDILYCFEIEPKKQALEVVFNKIFENFIIKLRNTHPEQIEVAQSYGRELEKQSDL